MLDDILALDSVASTVKRRLRKVALLSSRTSIKFRGVDMVKEKRDDSMQEKRSNREVVILVSFLPL